MVVCCDICPYSPTCEEEEDQVSHSYRECRHAYPCCRHCEHQDGDPPHDRPCPEGCNSDNTGRE